MKYVTLLEVMQNALMKMIAEMSQTALKKEEPKQHAFWNTQPVPQSTAMPDGVIDASTAVREEAYGLPDAFEWTTLDLANDAHCAQVYGAYYPTM